MFGRPSVALPPMPRSTHPRSARAVVTTLVTVLVALLASPGPASAHNTFQSSTPAGGATLAEPPAQISMIFAKAVPLDTASAEVVEATGVRTELTGLTHGPAGDTELIAPLPALAPGAITVRWRLVGPDGHPLTGRVTFTITAPTTVVAAVTPTTATPPTAGTSPSSSTTPALLDSVDQAAEGDGFSTPSILRWLLRYGSYLAIMMVLGVVLTDGFVWPGCASRPQLRHLIDRALATVAVLGAAQALILASDISGNAPWQAVGSLDAALHTDAGLAFALRILIAGCAWLVLRRMELHQDEVRWTAVGVAGAALMATWAFAGHSASQRWSEFGVPVDVIHHTAAATWVGGLAIVGLLAASVASPDEMPDILRRFARTAATAVALVVGTGILQSIRLVGNPAGLFEGAHGRLLLVKLVVLAAMLVAANANRKRVLRGTHRAEGMTTRTVAAIRQTIAVELILGVLILAITSAMVVSSPASADTAGPTPRRLSVTADSYTV